MDSVIIDWVNGFVGQSATFDRFVELIAVNPLVKGVPIAALFLFLWFLPRVDHNFARLRLVALLGVAMVAILLGRMAAVLFPYRPRPLHSEALDLQLPIGISPTELDGWSSFPSDHAVLYAALVTGFWIVNRWAGMAAALHALFVIAFGRVFLTLHFPSDILGGAVIGVIVTLVLLPMTAKLVRRAGVLGMAERWPQYFHPSVFIVLFQIATMFDSARAIVKAAVDFIT